MSRRLFGTCLGIVLLAAVPAAQAKQVRVNFTGDPKGYGAALVREEMPWLHDRGKVDIKSVQVDMDVDGQPEFFVRVEGDDSSICDEFGCFLTLFRWNGTKWQSVMQTRAKSVSLTAIDPGTGMAGFVLGDGSEWFWDGAAYDMIPY